MEVFDHVDKMKAHGVPETCGLSTVLWNMGDVFSSFITNAASLIILITVEIPTSS